MNALVTRAARLALLGGLFAAFTACSGGGGGGSAPTFTLTSITPDESPDLDGGGIAVIRGTNFESARVARVLFGDGNPGFGIDVKSQTELWVTIPPSPSGNPGPVTVEVESLDRGIKALFAGFSYGDGGGGGPTGPPVPTTVTPTVYTPTGAQRFTIGGSNFGADGTVVSVRFRNVGSVEGTVAAGGTLVRGNAPIVASLQVPQIPVQVFVKVGQFEAAAQTFVSFSYFPPAPVAGISFLEGRANASLPVRVANDKAVVATSTNVAWRDGNDDLVLITVDTLTNTVTTKSLLTGQAPGNRNLDLYSSSPIGLDNDTICVATVGPDRVPFSGDETILIISNLGSPTPTVSPPVAAPFIARAPIVRISGTHIAFNTVGTGALSNGPGTTRSDQLWVYQIANGALVPGGPAPVDIGLIDVVAFPPPMALRTLKALPFSPDGNAVFVYSRGPALNNSGFSDGDDMITRFDIAAGTSITTVMPNLLAKPVALSEARIVAPAKAFPGFDVVSVMDFAGGVATSSSVSTGTFVNITATHQIAALKDGNFVMAIGPDGQPALSAANRIGIFTDDGFGAINVNTISVAWKPLLAPLGDGSVMVFGPGPDNAAGTPFDRTFHIAANGAPSLDFSSALSWLQLPSMGLGAATDDTRAFALGRGDLSWFNGDEVLHVFQARSIGQPIDATTMQLSTGPLGPVHNTVPFVPVGFNWGLMLSPGRNGPNWNQSDDRVILVYY